MSQAEMLTRSSGVLLHPTSLPGPFGVGDLGPVGGREIVVEGVELGVDALADRLAAAAEVEHRGRGDADLGRPARDAREEIEVPSLDALPVADRRRDVHRRRLEADLGAVIAAKGRRKAALLDVDAFELLEKVDVEVGASELAVGDAA